MGLIFSWRSHCIATYWDMLVASAFGNFRSLHEAVTLITAMGYYLNTKGNSKENAAAGRVPRARRKLWPQVHAADDHRAE